MLIFKAHAKSIFGIAFSPDGQFLATSSGDKTVRLWDLNGPKEVRRFPGRPGTESFAPIAFSPDGRVLARGGFGLEVWNVKTSRPLIADPHADAKTLAFSPDGCEFAIGSQMTLRRWEIPSAHPLPEIWELNWRENRESSNLRYPCGAFAYSSDGSVMAASYGILGSGQYPFSSRILLWHRPTENPVTDLTENCSVSDPRAILFSPDKTVLVGMYGPAIQVFNLTTRSVIAHIKKGKKHFMGMAFTPDGSRLVAVNNDSAVRMYDTTTWAEIGGYEWKIGCLRCLAVAPDGLRMAAGSDTGQVVVWDVDG